MESLSACLMLLLILVPMAAVLLMSMRVEKQGEIRSIAYNVARYEMEQLKARTWANCAVTSDTSFSPPSSLTGTLPYGTTLSAKYNIAAVGSSANLRQVTVSVSWTNVSHGVGVGTGTGASGNAGTSGPTSEVRLSTLIAQQPYQNGQ